MRLSSLVLSLLLLAGMTPPILDVVFALQSQPESTNLAQDPPPPPPPPQQTKPAQKPQDQDEPIHLTSRLVLVPLSASDKFGNPVRDLTASDLVIEEQGKSQSIVSLGEPGKVPTEIALLFDVSGSIHGQFAFEQQAAVRFIKEVLKPADAISVFSIGTKPRIVQTRTASSQDAINGLMTLNSVKEPTAFFDTVVEAALYLGKNSDPGSRRVIIVISDGEENYSEKYSLNDALKEIQKNDCLFYSINPTGEALRLNSISIKGQSYMESMSTQTGGKAFVPDKIGDLENVFRQIAEELQAQYLLGYYSTDTTADGGFRSITVRANKRADLRLRFRQGYYAPKN